MEWTELLQLQASLREMPPMAHQVRPGLELPPPQELSSGGQQALSTPQAPQDEAVTQACAGFASEPAIGASFAALGDEPDSMGVMYIPPNTMGAVGPAHLMTMLNNKVRIQDRIGTTLSTVDLFLFWTAVGAVDPFDPRVYYDSAAGRWIASSDDGVAASRVLFAISHTDDPTGAWDFYAFPADSTLTTFADFDYLGYNGTWIAITANMFNNTTFGFAGSKMWVVDKATALSGGPITVNVFPTGFIVTASGFTGNSIEPCTTLDPAEPTLYMIDNSGFISGVPLLRLTRLTGTGPAPTFSTVPGSTISSPTSGFFRVINNFNFTQVDAPQLGDPRLIYTFTFRTSSAVFRNGRLWCTHSGGLPAPGTVNRTVACWYQTNPAAMPTPIIQSGQIDGGIGVHHPFPSIAVNCANDAVIGFSRMDASRFAEGSYVMRLAGDALGTTRPVQVIKTGESAYFKDFGFGINRWGDYSASLVDPVDDKTFWTIQEYAALRVGPADNDSRWGTWWGRLGTCGTPTVTDDPDPVVVCDGGMASFSVTGSASAPPLTYQWRKGGVPISGATSSTLTISPAGAADVDSYDVVIADGCGGTATSASASLALATMPAISDQPDPVVVCDGGMASFKVMASSNSPLTYQWRRAGVDIPGETGSTLTIASVTAGDIGTYDVVVSNGCLVVISDPASLFIDVAEITDQPDSLDVCEGDPVLFSVTATSSLTLTYQWRKDGIDIPGETGTTLSIASTSVADAGVYEVVVDNGCRALPSDPATLIVGNAPLITDQPDSVSPPVGTTVVFSVSATSSIPITYQWRRNGMDIIGETGTTLTIGPVIAGDAGTYDVVVTTDCGAQLSDPAELKVLKARMNPTPPF